MTQRSLMWCLTMAVLAGVTLLARRAAARDEGPPKPDLDVSLTSRTLPP